MRSCYRSQERLWSKKEEDISIVKNREGESSRVCKGSVEEGVYLTIKISIKITSVLCAEERWKEENSICQNHEQWTLFYFIFSLSFCILFYFSFLFLGSRVRVSAMLHVTATPSYNYVLW